MSARKKLRGAPVRLAGVVRRSRRALLLGTALQATVVLVLALPARAQLSPNARPTGGVVVGGSAGISQAGNATNIDQITQRAAINWQSFDVGRRQVVNFHQPNAAAVALNRVVGPNPSQIAGQINANGKVILENQDGITFTKGAQINTAGFIATAAGITNQNFMAGHMVFDQAAAPGAAVVNRGRITVTQAGIAALVAPQVANSGFITARLGHVVLAGATRFTLDLYGDGLVSIDVTGAVRQVPVGPHGATVPALVTNSGTILAAGGQIELTARAAAGLVQELVSAGGKISAPSVGAQTGQVVLNGIGGSIVVAGALLARGMAPGTSGGQIEVAPAGGDVRIASGAVVDASGQAGGGTVAIGTDLARAAGGPSVAPHVLARNVTVARGATIAANATASGHGGRVTVLAGEQTVMDGAIGAAGGPLGGDGGFVEVSGQSFAYGGAIDAGAAFGHAGQILFDPGTLDIFNGGSGSGSLDGSLGTISFTTDGTTAVDTVSNGAINAFGATADVVLQASTLLEVKASVSVSVSNNLTMQSGGNLLVDAGVTIDAGTHLSLGAGIDTSGTPTQAGGITLGGTAGTTALLNAGTIVLQGGTLGGIALAGVSLAATKLDLGTAGGGITQAGSGAIGAGILQSTSGIAGGLSLIAASNSIATIGSVAVTGGDFVVNEAGASGGQVTVKGPVSAMNVAITGAGSLLVAGSILPTAQGFLSASGSGGITIGTGGPGGTIGTGAASTVSLQGDAISLVSGGTINAGTIEVASFSTTGAAATITLGGGTTSLGLASLVGQGETLLRIGAVTPVGGTLTTTAQSIAIAGSFGASTANLELDSAGGITEGASGTLTARSLSGHAGGTVNLGNVNAIPILGNFGVAGGDFLLDEPKAVGLTVIGQVSAAHIGLSAGAIDVTGAIVPTTQAFLSASDTNGIAITGSVGAAGALVGLKGDKISLSGTSGTGTIIAGTLEVAPFSTTGTASSIMLGGGTSSLGLDQLVGEHETLLRIGAVTPVGGTKTITASSITVSGSFGLGTLGLELDTKGSITQGTGNILTAATLGGTVTTGSVYLDQQNQIGTIGNFTVSTGSLVVVDATTAPMTIAGPVVAAGVGINAGTLDVTGSVQATGTNILALWATGGTLGVDGGAVLTAATIGLGATGTVGIGMGGTAVVRAGSLLGVFGAGVNETGTGTIGAAILSSATINQPKGVVTDTPVTGPVTLAGVNTIAAIGSFTVNGGNFVLADAGAPALTLAGNLLANNITLGAGGIPAAIDINGGTVALATSGTQLQLNAGTSGISIANSAVVNAGNAGTLALAATGGGVTEDAASTLIAGRLLSTGTITNTVSLAGTANAIGTLGAFTVAAGDLILTEGTGLALVETGPVTVDSGRRVGIAADTLTLDGIVNTGTGAFAQAPATIDTTLTLGAGSLNTGSIVANEIDFGQLAPNTGTPTAGAITIAAGLSFGAGTTLGLFTTGTLVETAGSLTGGTLIGTANGASLTGANTIATLGSFAAGSGALSFVDAGTLTVTGPVSGTNVTLDPTALDPTAIVVAGSIGLSNGGTEIALSASTGGITLAGTGRIDAGNSGTVALATTGGGVTGPGLIHAATLISLGSVAGTVDLTGGNDVGTIGGFTVASGDFVLAEAGTATLGLAGTLLANNVSLGAGGAPGTIALNGGTIALNGGTMIALDAGAGGITLGSAALLNAGAGTVALGGSGGVNEAGTIIAGTLVSLPTLGATANLTGSNTIAVLGGFTVAGGDLALADGGATTLTVSGAVLANNVTIGAGGAPGTLDINGGTIALTGGSTLGLNAGAGGITLAGAALVNAGGGTVALGTAGGVVEAATATIASGTLVSTGSIGGTATLAGANTIAVLTHFLAGGLTLDTVGSLTVLGTVAAGGTVLAGNTATLLLNTGSALALGIAGTAGTLIGGVVSLVASGTIAEANGVVAANTLVASGAGGVSLLGASNAIGSFGNVAATGSGAVLLADTAAATVTGTISAPGSVYLQDTNPGGVGIATGGSMAGGSTTTVGVRADLFTNSGAISGGTFELAPNTTGSLVSLGTTGGPGLSLPSLAGITTPAVRVGRITLPGGAGTTTAGSIVVAGGFGAAATALDLETTGAISESAAGALTAGALTANATAITLASSANAITLAQGISASAGDVTLVDGANLTLAGTIGGNNLFVEVAATGGTLALGSVTTAPVLQAGTGGRISLVADRMTEGATTGATIAAAGGLVELAPYTSGTRVSLNGVAGTQLLLDPTLLGEIGTTQLAIGGFTNIPAGGAGTITAGTISVDGPVTLASAQATTLDLLSQGGIVEPAGGVLTLGTLIGSIVAGAVALGGPNAVGTLSAFAAPGASFALTDAGSLAVTGPVTAGGVTLTAGTLGVASAISAAGGTVALFSTAGTVGIDAGTDITGAVVTLASVGGTIGIGMGGTALVDATSLLALGGPGVNETATGTVIAGSLGGAGALTGTVDFSLGSNTIGAIGAITITGGDLVLSDPVSTLTLSGPASATNVTIGGGALGTPGTIVIPGTIGAGNNLNLTAGSGGITVSGATAAVTGTHIALVTPGTIALNAGTVSAGTTGTVTLGGSLGITEAPGAVLIAGLLQGTGASTGPVALDGTGNDIVALGGFTVSRADFALSDAAPTLTVAGPLSAQNATIGGGALSVPGSLIVSGDITTTGTLLSLASGPNGMTLGGTIAAGGGQVALSAGGGPIALTGSLSAAILTPSNVSNVTESGAVLTVTSLVGGSAINGNVILTGPSNAIGTLGNFAAGGTIAIDPSGSLTVAGPVQGADVTIVAQGSIDVAGGVTALGGAGTVALSGNGLGLSGGSVSAATAILNGGAGGVTIAANGITPSTIGVTTLALDGAGAIEDAASRITAATLISDLGVTGSINLAGSLNAIASIGRLAETGGTFALIDTGNLALTGPFSAPAIAVTTGGTGQVTAGGWVSATAGTLAVTSGGGGIVLGAGAVLTGAPVVLNAGGGPITLAGSARLGQSGEHIALIAGTGGINEAATSQILSGALTGTTTGVVTLVGANAITGLGSFTAAGGLTLDDGGDLTVTGPVSAGPSAQFTVAGALTFSGPLLARTAQLNAGALTISALIDAPDQVALAVSGSAGESGAGAIATALLTGSSGAATNLTGPNTVAELSNFTAGTMLTLDNAAPLLVAGTIRAPTMVITTTPYQVTIAGGTNLITGGIARPTSPLASDTFPTPAQGGAYFSDFQSLGAFTVGAPGGGPSILRIDAYNGGSVIFGGTGVNGPNTWLIIDLHGVSTALGTASGPIAVAALNVVFPAGSAGGGASFSGTIGGLAGQAAAGAGQIVPNPDSRFRFDSCAIGSLNCIVLPLEVLPIGNPLQEFSIGSLLNQDDDDDLFLPLVSRRDY